MSWMLRLYETYENCAGAPQFESNPLVPLSHTTQNAHVEVFLDIEGNFLDAKGIPATNTLIPATAKSMTGRTSGCAPFPLCEKIQYCGADYPNFDGRTDKKKKKSCFGAYLELLSEWCDSEYGHPKVRAVRAYVAKYSLVADLIGKGVLYVDESQKLLTKWPKDKDKPSIFTNKGIPAKEGYQDQGDVFVRWRVLVPGDPISGVWQDKAVIQSWIDFDIAKSNQDAVRALCFVSGVQTVVAKKHPGKIRHNGDGAKLISSQKDEYIFKYLGRFLDADQACQVGLDVSQKAHNALRWLIQRQGYRNGDHVIVTWETGGEEIPDPYKDTFDLVGTSGEGGKNTSYSGDAGEGFALKFKAYLRGYVARLGFSKRIVTMAIDSANSGRMAVTYYRELDGSEFIERVEKWHLDYAWHQNFGKDKKFIGTSSPAEIVVAAYGKQLDDKLKKSAIQRLIPSIIEGQPVPKDFVASCVRRAVNRVGLEHWEWEKVLGIACSLYRGYYKQRSYKMALEPERKTRDYLYGRLLATADYLEEQALQLEGEKRETAAARLMQRFADRPFSTWRTLELSLQPYQARLRSKRAGLLVGIKKEMDEIMCAFAGNDFYSDKPLTGEFLLGYHCQREEFWKSKKNIDSESQTQQEGEEQ